MHAHTEHYMKTEAEAGVRLSQAGGHRGLPTTPEAGGGREGSYAVSEEGVLLGPPRPPPRGGLLSLPDRLPAAPLGSLSQPPTLPSRPSAHTAEKSRRVHTRLQIRLSLFGNRL